MGLRFDTFADQLTHLTDEADIWRHTAAYGRNMGFSGCHLTMVKRTEAGLMNDRLLTDFPGDFESAYRHRGLVDIDPFLLFGCETLSAKKIVTRDLSSFPKGSRKHREFLDHASSAGAVGGIGVPIHSSRNKLFGGWMFSARESEQRFDLLCNDYQHELHLAAVVAYEHMYTNAVQVVCRSGLLSPRERECLRWLCAGIRVSMIADKLLISESAVNLYVSNAKRKLNAKTREQAVAKALLLGEIHL